jgi:hypothetical protein
MANPLAGGLPPTPRPDPQPPQAPSFTNALAMPPQQPQQQMPAAPSHQQTVAALRHFMAIVGELKTLYKKPDLGKTDMRSAIIDGTTKLVSERVITAASAVSQLTSVPDEPAAQRKWVQQMLNQTIAAQNGVLDHHAAGNHGTLDWSTESQHPEYDPDNHFQAMEGLAGNYRPSA